VGRSTNIGKLFAILPQEITTSTPAIMASSISAPVAIRPGDPLELGREPVSFGRNILVQTGPTFALQPRLFVNDPWELIAEGIQRALPDTRTRDIAQAFRRQAEDYFRAATIGRDVGVRPVLLYYAFLNLSKAYAIAKGNTKLAGKSQHGISADYKPKAIPGSRIKFRKQGVFQELLQLLDGNPKILDSDLRLGHLLPQILPGHRLWRYATERPERFLTVEKFEVINSVPTKEVWLNIYLNKRDLDRIGISEVNALSDGDFAREFEVVSEFPSHDLVCFQQRTPDVYRADPGEALALIIRRTRNRIWETVKIVSPYRKHYIYCCPSTERRARLPQMLSIYLLMFFFGSVTRYAPLYFEDLLESKYGPLFETLISESPMQFLYLMASDILGREVSKPAII
jgi:hypothetical protein